ncbi:MAG: tRNA (adenosine(37)-N6)-dimethylallyltransferase MiaA [Bacteroidota bacterium]
MLITILGPTATGKTALAARLAYEINGEIISADSRQVYRGMDIGTGKDWDDYIVAGNAIPYHLIDIVDPGYEYNIFEFQKDFLKAYQDILQRKKIPILCGGSGMYLEAILKGYRLARAESDDDFLTTLHNKEDYQLAEILKSYKTLHNITDLEDRPRLLKAIMVARSSEQSGSNSHNKSSLNLSSGDHTFPKIDSIIFGINYPRGLVKARITKRLEYRMEHGMIAEVEQLLARGITPERLMKYGLEYKFVTLFLLGKISRNDLFYELNIAIRQFAKRQMTWFRRMERQGLKIHWIDGRGTLEKKVNEILIFVNRKF